MTKQNQNQKTRKAELTLDDLESVSGGQTQRKAGKGQQEYLIFKLDTVTVSS